jgi:hypothetical protein
VYAVVNTGSLPIMLGAAFVLERASGDGWERLPIPRAFPAWGRRLDAGARSELTARVWEHAQPGRYRLRVPLRVDRDPHPGYEWVATPEIGPIEVTAEFVVAPK